MSWNIGNALCAQIQPELSLISALQASVELNFQGFSLFYQPIVNGTDGSLAGCEALLRWNNPAFPTITPQECVSCLEANGLIEVVGQWVLRGAVRQCAEWRKSFPSFFININVSSKQFESPGFCFQVLDILDEYGMPPHNVVLELTESSQVKDTACLGETFDFLRSQGVRIALDDFGTGYASLDIFRQLSADELKIERSFLERISYNVMDQALVQMLINLCHNINMAVCVEGIENPELESLLRQMSPDYLQGYHYACPLSADAFTEKYFLVHSAFPDSPQEPGQDCFNSMTYAPLRPTQPMQMEDLVNHAFAGIFQVGMDQEFTFLTCNEGYRRMLGYTASEIEKNFKNRALGFVHPDDTEYVNEEIRRQLGEGDTITIEFRIVRKDGKALWILGTGNVYHSPEGGSSLVVVIVNNDKDKRWQLKQLEQYKIYKKLMENLPTGVKLVRYDPDFTIDYISPGFLSLMGYTQEEMQTKFDGKYINLIHPEDRASVMSSIMEQLKESNVVTMRYRTPCKDGSLIWVETVSRLCAADADGIQRACSSVVDISEIMSQHPEKRGHGLNIANRYEMATSQWGEFLFEYNLVTDLLTTSENFNCLFQCPAEIHFSGFMQLAHPSDHAKILAAAKQCKQGEHPASLELRLAIPNESEQWFSMAFSIPERFGNTPVSVLGRLANIDKEKRKAENLLKEARLDSLTGLLNKGSTEICIRNLIENPEAEIHYALFVIDVDHFKDFNAAFGHFVGDERLRGVAKILQALADEGDIVGRVGGDSFAVFTPTDGSLQTITDKADHILCALQERVSKTEEEKECMSASIGIARYPEDGAIFSDLFFRARSALYRAKELGHSRWCLSNQSSSQKITLVWH